MTEIPDRAFVDDLGRRWEWCGGQPGTWAWRITDWGQRIAVAAVQDAVVASVNALGAALMGSSYKPIESSPIPDGEVADMLSDVRERLLMEESLPPGVQPTPQNMLRYYGIRT